MEHNHRERWPSRVSFVFAAIGSAVGLGNVWRFPYLVGKYGGGAFLLPYLLILFAVGIPLLIMEFALGQLMQRSAPQALARIDPRISGTGFGAVLTSLVVSSYYAVILAWSLLYLCYAPSLSWADDSATFFFHEILHISAGPEHIGTLQLPIVAMLAVGWVSVYFCIWKGVKSVSWVVSITMPLPVLLMTILLVRGLTLEGAFDGVLYYVSPHFSALFDNEVWSAALTQIFFTLTLGFGVMIAYGSYQDRDSDIASSAVITAVTNCSISIVSGFAVFSTLGYMAFVSGRDVNSLAASGPSLAFIVFPEALSLLPGAPFFSVLFFLMLFTLAIDSLFSLVEAVAAVLQDALPAVRKKTICFWLCAIGMLTSLPFATSAGLYYLDITDHYVTRYGLVTMGLLQTIAVGWLYGAERMRAEINKVSTLQTPRLWNVSLRYVAPVCLGTLLAMEFYVDHRHPYESYPVWTQWCFGWIPVLVILAGVFFYSLWQSVSKRE